MGGDEKHELISDDGLLRVVRICVCEEREKVLRTKDSTQVERKHSKPLDTSGVQFPSYSQAHNSVAERYLIAVRSPDKITESARLDNYVQLS
jgi:hypothetical protein